MSPALSILVEGKKFMWDGRVYATEAEASVAMATYRADRFDVHLVEDGSGFLVFTRRTVTAAAVAEP